MVNYADAINRAWKYSINAKRLGVFTVFLIIALSIIAYPIFFVYRNVTAGIFNLSTLIQSFALLFIGIVVAALIFLYSLLLFTHNYANQKSLIKSARFALSDYPRFLAVVVSTMIITYAVSFVSFIGFILSIISGLAFFFVYQEFAVSRSGVYGSLSNSYRLFMKNKLDTIITLVLTGILSMIIAVIFAIPILLVGFFSLASSLKTGMFMQTFLSNLGLFVATGLILLVGLSLTILFSNGMRTDVYMQLKKKKNYGSPRK